MAFDNEFSIIQVNECDTLVKWKIHLSLCFDPNLEKVLSDKECLLLGTMVSRFTYGFLTFVGKMLVTLFNLGKKRTQ